MAKRKILASALLLATSLLFGACLIAKPADIKTESPDVTYSGTITQAGTVFTITTADRQTIQLDSRQVDLSKYVGRSVTVIGQYSGTTLFVSRIE